MGTRTRGEGRPRVTGRLHPASAAGPTRGDRPGRPRQPSAEGVEGERAGVGVEFRGDAEGHGQGPVAVTEAEFLDDRDTEPAEPVGQYRPQFLVGPALRPGAQRDPGDAVEPAGAQELGQRPVDGVRPLPHVLQQQQPAAGAGPGVRGAVPGGEEGEAAAEGDAAGSAGGEGGAVRGQDAHGLRGEQRGPQVLLSAGVLHEVDAGGDGSVQRDQAEADGERLVQGGAVAEAEEHLRPGGPHRVPVEEVDHALGAVAAARADHRVDARVAPGALEVGRPLGVGAGQVAQLAVPVQDMGCGERVEVPAAQQVEAGLEPLLDDGSAGRDDGHTGAGSEPGRPQEVLHFASSRVGMPGTRSPNTCAYRDSSASRARTTVSARRKPCPSPSKAR